MTNQATQQPARRQRQISLAYRIVTFALVAFAMVLSNAWAREGFYAGNARSWTQGFRYGWPTGWLDRTDMRHISAGRKFVTTRRYQEHLLPLTLNALWWTALTVCLLGPFRRLAYVWSLRRLAVLILIVACGVWLGREPDAFLWWF